MTQAARIASSGRAPRTDGCFKRFPRRTVAALSARGNRFTQTFPSGQKAIAAPPVWLLIKIPSPLLFLGGVAICISMLVHAGTYDAGDWVVFACVAAATAFVGWRARDWMLRRGMLS